MSRSVDDFATRTTITMSISPEERLAWDEAWRRGGFPSRTAWVREVLATDLPDDNLESAYRTVDHACTRLREVAESSYPAEKSLIMLTEVKDILYEAYTERLSQTDE